MDKSTIRTIYALAAARNLPLLHLNIKSSFTTELHDHNQPVYARRIPCFNGKLTHHDRPIGRLRLHIYGMKPACHIYHAGLDLHLQAHDFYPSEADPCLYTHSSPTVKSIAAVTMNDFLVLSTSDKVLCQFKRLLSTKYRIKNLGHPTSYLGWTIPHHDRGSIHASQPAIISKSL